MSRSIHRRELLLAGVGLAAVAALPIVATARPVTGALVFDPRRPDSEILARQGRHGGQWLVALDGDPMRLWQDRLRAAPGPLSGVTGWSDFLALSEAAGERFMRVRKEEHLRRPGRPLLVSWTLA